jgi:ABC-type antimicrobial peptide transport system permease subunit
LTLGDVFRTATRPIRTRSLESALIVVAVALGVGVVTAMLALILNDYERSQGLSQSVAARELIVTVKKDDYRAFQSAGRINPIFKIGRASDGPVTLSEADLKTVQLACPAIEHAYLAGYFGLELPNPSDDPARRRDLQLMEVTQNYPTAAKLELLAGAWPSKKDFENHTQLIVASEWFIHQQFDPAFKKIDPNAKRTGSTSSKPDDTKPVTSKPFSLKNVIGKSITAKSTTEYKIIGVFATPKYGQDFASDSQTFGARGIVPYGIRSTEIGFGALELKFLTFADQYDAAREQLRTHLTRRYGEGVAVSAARDRIESELSVSRNAAIVTAIFASGGLMIAAINITNLMLARVLGRTRSIGISSALGASSRLIFFLYLTESLVLGAIGGLLGIGLARGITAGLEIVLQQSSIFSASVDLTLKPLHFMIGLLVALLVSVMFGAYPAWMASRVRPSEALRG